MQQRLDFVMVFSGYALSNFYIRVGDNFNETTFDTSTYTECWYQARTPVDAQTFFCTSVVLGRYVAIHFPESKVGQLRLCEVAVYKHSGYVIFSFKYINERTIYPH